MQYRSVAALLLAADRWLAVVRGLVPARKETVTP
jgi:hypothetical protein